MKKIFQIVLVGGYFTLIAPALQAQTNYVAPFVAFIQMNGNQDKTFNNNSYSLYVPRPDKALNAKFFYIDEQKNSYFSGTTQLLAGTGLSKPFVLKLEQNVISPSYSGGNTIPLFPEINPMTYYFNDYEIFTGIMHPDNGVVPFGSAKLVGTQDFYPFSYKANETGFLDNFYKEGGSFLLLNNKNNRIRSADTGNNFQAFTLEYYQPESSVKLVTSNLNGNNLVIGFDSLKNVELPIIKVSGNYSFIAAQTKVTNILADYFKDGGLTIGKFDMGGRFVSAFGNGGKQVIPVTSGKFVPAAIAIYNDLIYVAGKVGDFGIGIIRLKADGSLDETFGGDGISVKYLTNATSVRFGDMLVTGSGIYVAGNYTKTFFLYKVNFDGSFDISWTAGSHTLEFGDLHNFSGVAYASDKIIGMLPFKLRTIGTGVNQRLVIGGMATVKK